MKTETEKPIGMSINALAEQYEVDRRKMTKAIRKASLVPVAHNAHGHPLYDEEDALDALTRFFPLPPMTREELDESTRCMSLHMLYALQHMEENPGCDMSTALMAGVERRKREEA